LREAGIPVGVLIAPVIPAITDHEIPAIMQAAVDAGAQYAGYVMMRLPYAVKELFENWVGQHFPDRKDKVLNRIRALRGGKLNDPSFGTRMRGEGLFADQVEALFDVAARKAGVAERRLELSAAAFRVPFSATEQMQKTFPF
jgi:DNA repair photolyase